MFSNRTTTLPEQPKKTPEECEAEARYYAWIDEHHPEFWLEMDYWQDMERQWQDSLPSREERERMFPKENLEAKKQQMAYWFGKLREYKNERVQAKGNSIFWWDDLIQRTQEDLNKLGREVSWLKTPKKERKQLDIAKAKAFPLTDLLQFNRARNAKCLWHDEKHPSMHYYPRVNKVWCFVCNRGGDSIDVAQAIWKCTINEAVAKLV